MPIHYPVHHLDEVGHVAVVVLALVAVFPVGGALNRRRGVGAERGEAGVGPATGVEVAVGVVGEMIRHKGAVAAFEPDEGAELRGAGGGGVGAVAADLHGDGFLGGEARPPAQDAAGHLRMGVEGVEVDRADVVPLLIAGKGEAQVGRLRAAAARAAMPHPVEMAHLRLHAIAGDEGGVHIRVGPGLSAIQVGEALVFRAGHHEAEDGLRTGVGAVVHLQQGIRALGAAGVGGCGPGAGAPASIYRAQIVFNDGEVGLRGQRGAKDAVAREAVAVQAVVEQVRGSEGQEVAGGGHGGVAPVEGAGDADGDLVEQARGDGDGIGAGGDDGRVGHAQDEGREVVRGHAVHATGRAAVGEVGAPVLAVLVGQVGLHQFERGSLAIGGGIPFPA